MANMNQVNFLVDNHRAGAQLYKVRLREFGLPHLEKEKALGQLYSSLSVPEEDLQED